MVIVMILAQSTLPVIPDTTTFILTAGGVLLMIVLTVVTSTVALIRRRGDTAVDEDKTDIENRNAFRQMALDSQAELRNAYQQIVKLQQERIADQVEHATLNERIRVLIRQIDEFSLKELEATEKAEKEAEKRRQQDDQRQRELADIRAQLKQMEREASEREKTILHAQLERDSAQNEYARVIQENQDLKTRYAAKEKELQDALAECNSLRQLIETQAQRIAKFDEYEKQNQRYLARFGVLLDDDADTVRIEPLAGTGDGGTDSDSSGNTGDTGSNGDRAA